MMRIIGLVVEVLIQDVLFEAVLGIHPGVRSCAERAQYCFTFLFLLALAGMPAYLALWYFIDRSAYTASGFPHDTTAWLGLGFVSVVAGILLITSTVRRVRSPENGEQNES